MFDFSLALLGLLGLVFLLGVPYLLVSHTRLKSQVRDLEAKIRALQETSPKVQSSVTTEGPGQETAKSAPPWGEKQQRDTQVDRSQAAEREAVTGQGNADQSTSQPMATPAETDQTSGEPVTATQAAQPGISTSPQRAARSKTDEDQPPRAFVLRGDLVAALSLWLRENWVLLAGAASLALAGLFMVQYGVENGLLTPFWRVMASLGFGTALIAGAEVIRRRLGDATEGAAQHLPSALAGAGLITLFAGLLSARVMYQLIEPSPSFAALGLVSLLALVLGWYYGAFLTALGLVGACAVPFLVGGQSQDTWMLYYYFALIATVGLGVDTVKRWAWISGLALAAPLSASLLLYLSGAGEVHFLTGLLLVAAAAVILPERRLWPRHAGPAVVDLLLPSQGRRRYPEFPTRVSAATSCAVAAAAVFVAVQADQAAVVTFALAALVALLLASLLWMRQAPALFDHVLVPGVAILVVVLLEGISFGPLFREFQAAVGRPPETAAPQTIWALVAIGALGSGLAYLRMRWSLEEVEGEARDRSLFWALAAACFAPAMLLILEFTWMPTRVHGVYTWALVVLNLAAAMTFLTERCARGQDIRQKDLRVALFAISALTLIAFALFLVLAKTALTLALSVMVVLVVLLDRKYDLAELVLFVQIAVAVITYRLVLDPGVDWALDRDYLDERWQYVTPLLQIILGYLGSLVLLGLGWFWARQRRAKTALILESAATLIGAVFLSVLILRLLPEQMRYGHVGMGLMATVWTASLINQLQRMQMSGTLTVALRGLLMLGYGLAALSSLVGLLVFANPLLSSDEMVLGPLILDSLAAAYLPLAAVLAFAAARLDHLRRWGRVGFTLAASVFAALYLTLEIRRFWRGDDLSLPGVIDAELYSYTVALLLISAGGVILAFWRRSDLLRRLAMAGVVLTIAKVFLVDMSGLSGLTRVFSFMGLGLALVALAWLNRVMNAQWAKGLRDSEIEEP
ncbi:DUF2339 domain-containing protein [Pseudophaeobacter sp. EL27]|uniref:DUF2339 domain-containing protein n=1 Tax=Pseudophaeobacter sp. EL27 TaxID=2107580 RepID=UPI000EFB0A0D|nr:DUF2339 domain-containing protein [Pseudophaeobacter sp. EL27]